LTVFMKFKIQIFQKIRVSDWAEK